jgi:hypothetical protein
MPTWLSLILAGLAGICAVGLLAGVMLLAIRSPEDRDSGNNSILASNSESRLPAIESMAASAISDSGAASSIWPNPWTHDTPGRLLTVDEAHREMQVHRNCRLDGCVRKAAAFSVLIEAGRVKPDTSRQGY